LKSTGIVEEISNQLVKSEYLICDVLAKTAKNVAVQALAVDEHFGEALVQRLDHRSFPSWLGQGSTRPYALCAIRCSPGKDRASGRRPLLRRFVLCSQGGVVGDVDQSGTPDWLVWFSDEASGGNDRGFGTLLVEDVTGEGPLRAQPL
jgi:hypothetical protein